MMIRAENESRRACMKSPFLRGALYKPLGVIQQSTHIGKSPLCEGSLYGPTGAIQQSTYKIKKAPLCKGGSRGAGGGLFNETVDWQIIQKIAEQQSLRHDRYA